MVELEVLFIGSKHSGGAADGSTQRRSMGPTEAQLGGDIYVPDTEGVYWQRNPAESAEGERRQRHAKSGREADAETGP